MQFLPAEVYATFQQDLRLIKEKKYRLPWDMTTPGHRQYNPGFVLGEAWRFLSEARNVLGKRFNPEMQINRPDRLPFMPSNLYPVCPVLYRGNCVGGQSLLCRTGNVKGP
jgi:hypothetical protein